MALADVYVLEDHQLQFGTEEVLNVYTFQRDDGAGSAAELIAAFLQDVQVAVENIQTTDIEHVFCRAYSLGNLEDFAEVTETGNSGTRGGTVGASFVAVNYTLRAASRAVRPGSKRFAGIPNDVYTDDIITDATTIGLLETLRLALYATIESPNDATTYSPVIVKRVPYVTPKGKDAYRWPETDGELVAPLVTGALLNLKVSHQVSRGNSR